MNVKTTRDHIVEAADRLFYWQGYEHTSFSDIAGAVEISRGNFYHHFKSKDEILDAVIKVRLVDTQEMLERWEIKEKEPAERIQRFFQILIENRDDIKRYGCPVGTLCTELAKLNHASQDEANRYLRSFALGCAGNSRCWVARWLPTNSQCIFLPAARAQPHWQTLFKTRNS